MRCGARLAAGDHPNLERDAALAAAALVLLTVANLFPILEFDLNGRVQAATVLDGVVSMWQQQRYELAVLILLVAILIPALHAVAVLVRSQLLGSAPGGRQRGRWWAVWSERLAPWGMTEVYLLGALVAFVKLGDLASVVVGPALYAFAAMSVLTAWSSAHAAGVWAALRRR